MAKVKPFKGVRPPRELVENVASRPYDVLNSDEARAEAEGNPKSLYHIIKPEIDFEPGTDEHDPRVYDRAVENFNAFQKNGWLVQDDKEHYYIYAQTMDGRTQYGIVIAANVDDYMQGRIKKHELTRRDKEEDRMKHVVSTMQTSNRYSSHFLKTQYWKESFPAYPNRNQNIISLQMTVSDIIFG